MAVIDSVQSLSHIRLFATPWTKTHQASLSITNSWSPPKPKSIESVMPSNHLILCRPLLLLPSIRVFSIESSLCIRWPKIWSFSFSISPSNKHPELISFRMDWLDLQGTLIDYSLIRKHNWMSIRKISSKKFKNHPESTLLKLIFLWMRYLEKSINVACVGW